MFERLGHALLGGVFGALLGLAGWWLYGLAHSLVYDGPGMDPVLRHWLVCLGGVFALFGFIFRGRVVDFFADALGAALHFEFSETPGNGVSTVFAMVFLALVVAAIWYTVPG